MIVIENQRDLSKHGNKVHHSALVATMGNLHEGHLALVDLAKKKADQVIVSIFVNPLQFSPREDFAEYPRTLSEDIKLLEDRKVDFLFLPQEKMFFPQGKENAFTIKVPSYLADVLCGKTRPHFFHGVASIVFKLFQFLKPKIAIFGEKDYQQFLVIKEMVDQFALDVKLYKSKIIREKNGLALSSRNRYLTKELREKAHLIHRYLLLAKKGMVEGNFDFNFFKKESISSLEREGIMVEYFEIRDNGNLALLENDFTKGRIFLAAKIGSTRLIDNLNIS